MVDIINYFGHYDSDKFSNMHPDTPSYKHREKLFQVYFTTLGRNEIKEWNTITSSALFTHFLRCLNTFTQCNNYIMPHIRVDRLVSYDQDRYKIKAYIKTYFICLTVLYFDFNMGLLFKCPSEMACFGKPVWAHQKQVFVVFFPSKDGTVSSSAN